MFTVAAAPFRIPKALITASGMRSWGWLISKLPRELRTETVSFPPFISLVDNNHLDSKFLPLGLRAPVLVTRDLYTHKQPPVSIRSTFYPQNHKQAHVPGFRQRRHFLSERPKTRSPQPSAYKFPFSTGPTPRPSCPAYHCAGCSKSSLARGVVVPGLKTRAQQANSGVGA